MIDVGQTIGNYNVTAKLGEGGMGTVFLAEHPVIGSKVALKAIHPQYARDANMVSRFVTEAKSVNQIGHDHIVDITDFGHTADGDFYFIMEYLEGRSLADAITQDGPFPPARALTIAAQIADALSSSHEHGVIHRDLKPENIFLIVRDDTSDFVKVLDFGLAKLTHPDDPLRRDTGPGSVMGTPFYMAPEQCEGKADLDHRTDVYALGVIIFEMLTGMVPFGGRGYGEILIKQITVQPPAASSIRSELSPALDLILFRALAKDPGTRFQTMAAFREALLVPEGYAASGQVTGALDDLSLRVRVAMPMPRAEARLQLARRLTPAPVDDKGPAPSTFRSAVGALETDDDDLKPKRHRRRGALLAGLVVFAGVGFGGRQYRRQATRLLAAVVSPKTPMTVLVTFNSDPDGATVAQSDGTVLGVTPLLMEVPFGDIAIEYVIRKEGYLAKIASIVPKQASPFFAVLEARPATAPAPAPLVVALPVLSASSADRLPPMEIAPKVGPRRPRPRPRSSGGEPAEADDDGVMDPSPP
jgi:Protein kinase domain